MLTQRTLSYQPGLLQPHGTILVLGRGARVEAAGSNAEEVLGLSASACRGKLASELFSGEEAGTWRAGADAALAVELEVRGAGRRCWGTLRANEQGKRLLELEPSGAAPALGAWASALDALGAAREPEAVGRALARGLELLGCFEVVVRVRAEADERDPFAALAASLGRAAPQLLAELAAAPAELLGAGDVLDEGQDLAAARLRVPSPEALAALRALGGAAALHVPLVGAAAGEAVLAVAPQLAGADRRAAELLARAAERRLGELAARGDLRAALRGRAACTQLLEAAARERAFERSLSGSLFMLQRLIANDGFALWTPHTCCAVGVAPRAEPLGEFVAAFDGDRRVQRGACVLSSAEEPLGRAARYLAAPLPDRGWLLWFRTSAEAAVPDWSPGELHLAEALAHEVLPAAERVADTAAMGRSDAGTLLAELSRERERRARERRHLLEFVSVASHDLRAPIRNLGSLVQWLREDHLGELSEDAQQLVGLIEDRVRKATQLVDGVLAYSRLGVEDVPCEEVDLEALVGELLDILEVPARIRVEVERPLPAVRYRPLQLRQLLQNLLDNALKYNDKPQGVVRVRCHDREAFWELQVEDDGVGIKPEDQERIFAIFRRASGSAQEDGTGVGLAIVKRIAEAHGGATWVESIPRRGSRFSVTIPKDPEA